ncbi:3-isopropylmalate dehydratase small subunit [Sphingobium sp. TCM1]|uniref:3-isopropylmalate dehydratase small subunit n=1 Tax=Sphingobium sp. TCM1 TaxID=453246 RepID=UPI0007F4ACF6|nr:3-isopropylmalate dehydratase small subunit [Sphingobium sp. TCM1]OAN56569.1 3-isopropylmalate dehydratase small subunit [Sphingobium sp. TCM1]
MTPFTELTAVAMPLLRDNIDTDAIIPSREMKSVSKTGLADGLFAGWRYLSVGGRDRNPDFILNDPAFAAAQILLGGANFGCGSSREHAAWALAEYGFRAIVAPSFNPIFRGNCVRNGIVPVELPADIIAMIAAAVVAKPDIALPTVNLANGWVGMPDGRAWPFALEEEARTMLLEGLDAIELTLKQATRIVAFRDHDRALRPWVYL